MSGSFWGVRLWALFCLLLPMGLLGQTISDVNEGLRVEPGSTPGSFVMKWFGKSGRTYFIQTSESLMSSDWLYVPVIESGTGAVIQWGFSSTGSRFFLRLQYTDATYTGAVGAADFDGDKVSNMDELENNTDPLDTSDLDADLIPRDWEIAMGLNPGDAYDMLLDLDGDRRPNLYEYMHGTHAANALSFRQPDFIVDEATGVNTTISAMKKTIQYAINLSDGLDYRIIRVRAGVYDGFANSGKKILLLGDVGGKVIIRQSDTYSIRLYEGASVIRDVVLVPGTWRVLRYPVVIYLPSGSSQAALVNCSIRGQGMYSRAPITLARGTLTLSHSTITQNFSGSAFDFSNPAYVTGAAGAVSLFDDGETSYSSMTVPPAGMPAANQHLIVRDSVLWNPATLASEIFSRPGSSVQVHDSLVRGGAYGALDETPLIDRYGYAMSGSPTVRGGSGSAFPRRDIQGEANVGKADYGVDEHLDTDADGLPDWWEISSFGSVTAAAAAGDQETAPDGLTNMEEYLLGYLPLNRTTLGVAGETDLLSALLRPWDAFFPTSLSADLDEDGLSTGWERYLGTSDSQSDSNGDGIADGVAWSAGIGLLAADVDGDGLNAAAEAAQGTNPLSSDSDGDGVSDGSDAYPLDPFFSELTPNSGDNVAPLLVLEKPAEAVLVP